MAVIKNKEKKELVWKKYGQKCAYCGADITIDECHIDHIEPKLRHLRNFESDKKGKDVIEKYNPSCSSCNSSKWTYSVEEWRNEIELKKKRLLTDSSIARILLRFELLEIKNEPVTFYFEKHG